MDFIDSKIQKYSEDHTDKESDILKELNRETHLKILKPRMLSGHLQGRALSMFSKMIAPKYILEIGTYTGYSAICMAEGLQADGKLITIDINEELESIVSKYVKKAGYEDRIIQKFGNALDILPELDFAWDLVFIDADKDNYANYYDLVIDKVNVGGYIIADNVLWSGKVVEEVKSNDKDTQALIEFNKKVHTDNRVENILLPIRDGLMILRKK
ncbi:O-methyltransferase [Fulvivirga lutea]|uniref:Class I SAM-dependent methyltransferase n=1 Tax=Fulvivirga lutea TaxID=2810512 RepID=A0A974WI82_9BACT|nr:class I SAM-dependent methyltransferase [Fulvivirga lutea]QSE97637.1 class I SAM-dependent methyltransferase [Fulvivirga lutea]